MLQPHSPGSAPRSAVLMVLLMLFSSLSAIGFSPLSSAHPSQVAEWPMEGSNDTGWVLLEAMGANPSTATDATGQLMLDFAPGAEISNLTFEIQVNGSDGVWADQPQLTLMDTQTSLLDWRTYGDFGRAVDFLNGDPHTGRLSPTTDTGATHVLPAGVTITDLVIEALRPADPLVSFERLEFEVKDWAMHPADHRLYVVTNDNVLVVDANNEPWVIDVIDLYEPTAIEVDATGGRILIASSEGVSAYSADDFTPLMSLGPIGGQSPSRVDLAVDGGGDVWAVSDCSIERYDATTGAWTADPISTSSGTTATGPCAGTSDERVVPTSMFVDGSDLYVGTQDHGITMWDGTTYTHWDTQNALTSDTILGFERAGDVLYISTADGGVMRKDLNTGSWLATWSSQNWLSSDDVQSMSVTDDWIHILAGDVLHTYNGTSLTFTSSDFSTDLNVPSPITLLPWRATEGVLRGPVNESVLLIGSSGRVSVLEAGNSPSFDRTELFANSPSSDDMMSITRLGDVYWIGGADWIDRFDSSQNLWIESIRTNEEGRSITTDGTDIYLGTAGGGLMVYDANGSLLQTLDEASSPSIASDFIQDMSYDAYTSTLSLSHPSQGLTVWNLSSGAVTEFNEQASGVQELDSDDVGEIATRSGIVYIGSDEEGVMRIDLTTNEVIGSWQSLGADELDWAPIASDGTTVWLGLDGFGVLVYDRVTGEVLDRYTSGGGNQPGQGAMQSNDVFSVEADPYGGVLVGTSFGLERFSNGQGSSVSQQGRFTPREFFDTHSDSGSIWAATDRGLCRYTWTFQFDDCWDDDDDIPDDVRSVRLIGNNKIYVGTENGAVVWDTANEVVLDTWEAGEATNNAKVVVHNDIAYVGFDGAGIQRYDLVNSDWLSPWDQSSNVIGGDGVTSLALGESGHTLWAGGNFGLAEIDLNTSTVLRDWDKGTNSGGPTLSNWDPMHITIYGGILHYAQQLNYQNSRDLIFRINLSTDTSLSELDVGARIGTSGNTNGMNMVGDELWVGVTPSQWWTGIGAVVRWNVTNGSWADTLDSTGNIERVNAQYLGDCFPLDPADCELWVAYGENYLRRYNAANMTLLGSWDDVDGRIRGMVEFNGEYLFGSLDGLLRFDPTNDTWLTRWNPNNGGMPSSGDEDVYTVEVVGDDLWVGTYAQSGWNTNADIHIKNGTTGQWQSIAAGSGSVPSGYPADIGECAGIVHVGMGSLGWWAPGGVARYDLSSNSWIGDFRANSGEIDNDDVRAVSCDQPNEIVYFGYDTDGIGIGRYIYGTQNQALAPIDAGDGISEEAVFPGGLLYHNNRVLIAHVGTGAGGFSQVPVTGTTVGSGSLVDPGLSSGSIVLKPTANGATAYAIARNGESTGNSRVDLLDSNGLTPGGIDSFVALSSGRILEFLSHGNKVYAVQGEDVTSGLGTSILEGTLINGTVRWDRSFSFGFEIVNEIYHDGTDLWVSTIFQGLIRVDLTTGQLQPPVIGFHWNHDGIVPWNGSLVIGLMGTDSTAAGVQVYDVANNTISDGKLIAALPSNFVWDFEEHDGRIWIATIGGLGVWNLTTSDWDDPFTVLDGLPFPYVRELGVANGNLLVGTWGGVAELNTTTMTVVRVLNEQAGLIGTTVSGLTVLPATTIVDASGASTVFGETMFVAHDGRGITRPGYTEVPTATMIPSATRPIDMIPDNAIESITADAWGVHIATVTAPIIHWNASSGQMEDGPNPLTMAGYPPNTLVSDGNEVVSIGLPGITYFAAGGSHLVDDVIQITDLMAGHIDSDGLAAVGSDGLHLFAPISHNEADRFTNRRADPLTVLVAGANYDITNQTHPGRQIVLIDSETASVTSSTGAQGPNGIQLIQNAVTSVSPILGAATWMSTTTLNYTGIWDLAELDSSLESSLQNAIDNAAMSQIGRQVELGLQSPSNGSIWVRLTYDWVRLEQPTEVLEFFDRPDDGGETLIARWSPSTDHGWVAYRIYVWETTEYPNGLTSSDIEDLTDTSGSYDARIPAWAVVSAELTTSLSTPLVDGVEYGISIVTEYSGGLLGEPSNFGNFAIPIDNVPNPPVWVNATIDEDQEGRVMLEWSACTELDHAFTHYWRTPIPIPEDFPYRLPRATAIPAGEANTTFTQIPTNDPFWFAFVCTDESGQFDESNATIVGPVIWTALEDDGTPPAPVEDIVAFDTPDDEGGHITIEWTANEEEDCAFYEIYGHIANSETLPSDVVGWDIALTTFGCAPLLEGQRPGPPGGPPGGGGQGPPTQMARQDQSQDATISVVVNDIAGRPIQDGIVHWFTVVAVDLWQNKDLENVTIVEATSVANVAPQPPERITNIEAWDTPDDDGTSIDVSWTPSFDRDLEHYVVWVSEHPVTTVGPKWSACSEDPDECGLILVERRGWAEERIEITVDTALYGGSSVSTAQSDSIQPDVKLYVTVTAHDQIDNVYLTRLETVEVTPIDNRGDITPPSRLDAPTLADRPDDLGDALHVSFDLSLASDLDRYEVFTSSLPFTDASTMEPAAVLERNPDLPAAVEIFSRTNSESDRDALPLAPGVETWVAVVPVDSSGNALYTDLLTSSRSPIDNSLLDPGLHLPEITGVTLRWSDDGNSIIVEWDISEDAKVRSYWIYASNEVFEDTRDARLVKDFVQGVSYTFDAIGNDTLDQNLTHYVTVVAHDGEVHRFGVTAQALLPYDPTAVPNPGDSEDAAWWEALGVQTVVILILLGMIIAAMVALFVMRRKDPSAEWAHLAQGTYGIQNQERWDDDDMGMLASPTVAPPPMDAQPVGVAQVAPVDDYNFSKRRAGDLVQEYDLPSVDVLVQEARYHDDNQDQYLNTQELTSAAKALRSGQQRDDDLDMSFLDDLL